MSKELNTEADRLNYARKQAGKTFNELAQLIGNDVTGNALNTALNRNTVKEYYKEKIIKVLHLNKKWVELGEGEIYADNISAYKKEASQVPFEEFMEASYLPVTAQAGYLSSLEGVYDMELQTMLVPKEFDKGDYAVIEISGPSMDDGTARSICDGDKLLVKEWNNYNKQLPYLHHLFVIVSKEGLVCKQITKHNIETGQINCRSFNPLYPDYEINMQDVLRLFIVKKIVERRIKI